MIGTKAASRMPVALMIVLLTGMAAAPLFAEATANDGRVAYRPPSARSQAMGEVQVATVHDVSAAWTNPAWFAVKEGWQAGGSYLSVNSRLRQDYKGDPTVRSRLDTRSMGQFGFSAAYPFVADRTLGFALALLSVGDPLRYRESEQFSEVIPRIATAAVGVEIVPGTLYAGVAAQVWYGVGEGSSGIDYSGSRRSSFEGSNATFSLLHRRAMKNRRTLTLGLTAHTPFTLNHDQVNAGEFASTPPEWSYAIDMPMELTAGSALETERWLVGMDLVFLASADARIVAESELVQSGHEYWERTLVRSSYAYAAGSGNRLALRTGGELRLPISSEVEFRPRAGVGVRRPLSSQDMLEYNWGFGIGIAAPSVRVDLGWSGVYSEIAAANSDSGDSSAGGERQLTTFTAGLTFLPVSLVP